MKRQIRQGVFETNSSSTHSICIATETEYDIPKRVEFGFGEFGWAIDKLSDRKERADYLYTCISYVNDINQIQEYLDFIYKTLRKHGVDEIYFDSFALNVYAGWSEDVELAISSPNYTYVDHGGYALEFVDAVCTNEKLLLDYLFSDKSFILTGNDNDDEDVDIRVEYPHEEFYKGN